VLDRAGADPADRDQLVSGLVQDPHRVAVSAADRAMLDYALKLTRTPGTMTVEDVAALRQAGFDDRAIHDICAITAYFAFVNRMADGLGVELEDRFRQCTVVPATDDQG
jgi:uncharacterized peroxidase-related enzyme